MIGTWRGIWRIPENPNEIKIIRRVAENNFDYMRKVPINIDCYLPHDQNDQTFWGSLGSLKTDLIDLKGKSGHSLIYSLSFGNKNKIPVPSSNIRYLVSISRIVYFAINLLLIPSFVIQTLEMKNHNPAAFYLGKILLIFCPSNSWKIITHL